MELNIYWASLFIFVPIVVLAAGLRVVLQRLHGKWTKQTCHYDNEAKVFRKVFLRVYLIVMASEWLQGPYLYTLFRDEKGLEDRTVAILYITTYVSAAISAFFTGYLADRFGRRAACLVFCGAHSLASISVKFDAMELMIIGRVLSGISLNLLWTVFESWMITEYSARALDRSSLPLSAMFGAMTRYNCVTAILAGIIGYYIVLSTGSKANPFIAGVVLDVAAAFLMFRTWNENKGVDNNLDLCNKNDLANDQATTKLKERPLAMLRDARIWVLSFVSCCFEGTMFIFTFFWPGTLQEAHSRYQTHGNDATPFGVIFATFMATMVLGAMLFSLFTRNANPTAIEHTSTLGDISPTALLTTALFIGGSSFIIAAFSKAELHLYLAFLLLEFCNGIYVPSMAYHRGMIVANSSRTLVYGLMNIPLFVFVVIALYTTTSNGVEYRRVVFASSALLLLAAGAAVVLGLGILTNHLKNSLGEELEKEDLSEI
ncbi:MFS general substrate transporter [Hypoxylon trugodes]|uniref:MFS general substrate transporter n=1 Tax=Hypoxylon trugodes TaxID=326681 RepID=UPI0021A140FD|nr:MFS general substrate transporter [Hypoxylon trugodes]KAI1382976.1 MFS general substrate transporter [Hypoxylon trugodes]